MDGLPLGPQIKGTQSYRSPLLTSILIIHTQATERAWEGDYVGDAVAGLVNHIQKHYGTSRAGNKKMPYAHYTSIVQSSGMGKSRLVDEFSKTHFVIRMNLRGEGSKGEARRSMS